jgi:arsenate reductase
VRYKGPVTVTVYQYPRCSTCRKALAWLDGRGVAYRAVDLVDKPPTKTTLARIRKLADVPVRKLFNTSGQSYRQGGFNKKLETMSDTESLEALAADGKLVKRPLLVLDERACVGFREAEWAEALGGSAIAKRN